MEHDLKCWPEHFEPVARGLKTLELRLNDRNYQVGDTLHLREFEPLENAYTGRSTHALITHIVSGGEWLTPGYVALSIRVGALVRAERERIADGVQAQHLRRVKDLYDKGWNDALDVIAAALRA